LNPNDDYALTGYYVLDNRYFADNAHTKEPFYWVDSDGKFFFKNLSTVRSTVGRTMMLGS
jgi:hypothetical protein